MTDFDAYAFLDAAAAAIDLPVPVDARAGVAANLARLHALAQQVLASGIVEPRAADPEVGG